MGRSPCCEKLGLKKGPWTPEEDQKLMSYIEEHGHGCWRALPAKAGLQRCGKSCRLRWTNYLRPDIKRGKFTAQEEQTIIQLHALLGNRWSAIASHLPKRTDNEIKNFWNTHLKKRLAKMGIDPVTHKPKCDALAADTHASSKTAANLSHMAQWESARLEAEARLVRESKLLRFASRSSAAAGDHVGATAASVSCSVGNFATPTFQLPPLPSAASTMLPVEMNNILPVGASPTNALQSCFDVLGVPTPGTWQNIRTKVPSSVGNHCPNGGDAKTDLESPTSTLSYSDSVLTAGAIGLVDHRMNSCTSDGSQYLGQLTDGNGESEATTEETDMDEVNWKCFPKSSQFLDAKDRSESFLAAELTVDSCSSFEADNVSSWLHEALKSGPPPVSAAASAVSCFGDGFTEMLLNMNSVDVDGSTRRGDVEEEEEEEEGNKSYWNSILNLISSMPSSNIAPDCVLV